MKISDSNMMEKPHEKLDEQSSFENLFFQF